MMKNFKKYFTFFLAVMCTSFVFPQEEEVEEVVVISSKVPVVLSEVIGSVNLITQEDIEERLVNDMSEIFDTTVGVSVNTDTAYDRYFDDGISIRGLGGTRVNIFVDGIRISDAYTGYGRDVVDTELLKKVEILKGPSSALYGSDGLAGAVSYITKDPKDYVDDGSFGVASYGYYGNNEHSKISILGGFASSAMQALIMGTIRDMSESSLHDESIQSPNPMNGEGESIFSKFIFSITENIDLLITTDLQSWSQDWDLQTDLGMSFFPSIAQTTESTGDDEGSRERADFSINVKNGSSLFDQASIKFFSQDTEQKQITNQSKALFTMGFAGPPSPIIVFKDYQFNQKIEGFSFEMNKSIALTSGAVHDLVVGATQEVLSSQRYRNAFERNLITGVVNTTVDGEIYPGKTFPDTDTTRTGFFVNDRITLNESTVASLGLRFDSHELEPKVDALYQSTAVSTDVVSIDDSETSLKAGILHDINDSASVFLQYAEGFRSPDYESANLSFTNFAFGYAILTSPDLESETSKGYEIGLRGDLESARWSIAYYNNEYENFIGSTFAGFNPMTGMTLFRYANLDELKIQGIEVNFDASLSDNIDLKVGFNGSNGEQNDENYISIDPPQTIVALGYTSNDNKARLSGVATLNGESTDDLPSACGRSGDPCLTLPNSTILDLFFTYKLSENIKFNLAAKNVSDEKFWNWSTVNGLPTTATNLDLLMQPGRNYSATIRLSF